MKTLYDYYGIQFLMEDGSIISHTNTDDWDNAKWYQKLIGYIFRSYKNKFIKPEPFKAKIKIENSDTI